MMETLGLPLLPAPQAAIWLGGLLGLAFGVLAAHSRLCLRRGLVAGPERRAALAVWATAFAVAVAGTQTAVAAGLVAFDAHRFHATELPLAAVALGGAAFGAGMVLTRGCPARLVVLGAAGNLRALAALLLFALVAHATMKGVLAPARLALDGLTLPLGEAAALDALPGGGPVWAGALAAGALALVPGAGARPGALAAGAAIGALVPLGWVGTGLVLHDPFEPVAMQSLAFTGPAADTLFYAAAATAVSADFGIGLVAGAFLGAALAAALRREIRWVSFETPGQTGRSALGAALMGAGGVLAGGCTIGAGLSGASTLGLSALLALAAIVAGARAADALTSPDAAGSAGPAGRRRARPAA
jgi:uncharacterized membrane protein YedE/YeeE